MNDSATKTSEGGERKEKNLASRLGSWHRKLHGESGTARRDRAELRRAHTIDDALLLRPFYTSYCTTVHPEGLPGAEAIRADAAFAVLAIELADQRGYEHHMARRFAGNPPRLAEARFRRILEARDLDALFSNLRRAVRVIEGADIVDLYHSLRQWEDPKRRRRWASDYYRNTPEPKKR